LYLSNIVKIIIKFLSSASIGYSQILDTSFTANIISDLEFTVMYKNVPNKDLYSSAFIRFKLFLSYSLIFLHGVLSCFCYAHIVFSNYFINRINLIYFITITCFMNIYSYYFSCIRILRDFIF